MNKPPKYWPGEIVRQANGGSRKIVVLECRLDIEGEWKYQCLYSVINHLPEKLLTFDEEDLSPLPSGDQFAKSLRKELQR